jgi:glycosyltransferase involved in cell wall biosynthesis
MPKVDLFVSFAHVPGAWAVASEELADLSSKFGLGAIVQSTTCVFPDSCAGPENLAGLSDWRFVPAAMMMECCEEAMDRAARAGRALLVMLEPMRTGTEQVAALLDALSLDPHFGFAVPRWGHDGLQKLLPDAGDREVDQLPRRVLCNLQETYLLPEFSAPCFLVRAEVLASGQPFDAGFDTLAGAWLHYMCRARRKGFRCIVVNHAVMEQIGSEPWVPYGDGADYWKLHRIFPCTELARREIASLPAHRYESLLARAGHVDDVVAKTLLIDARGVPAFFNGTSHATLELIRAIEGLESRWRFTVLAGPEAIRFHRLNEVFAGCEVASSVEDRYYTAALRLCQPWDLQTIFSLHNAALFSYYLMLDTISWDVLYNGGSELQSTWRFLAQYADGVFYISDYTRQRFRARFPQPRREFVCHLSFHPLDYASTPLSAGEPPEEPYILIVGNDLDHKDVGPTLDMLSSAFPFHRFKALGCKVDRTLGNVAGIPSGFAQDEEIDRLYSQARMIVFPSFYEGFGFPMLKGLSCDRVVMVRRSELVTELAARYSGPGVLYTYEAPWQLVELVGRLLHGESAQPMPFGSALQQGQEPMRWPDIARRLLETLEDWAQSPQASCWRERQGVIDFARRYRDSEA